MAKVGISYVSTANAKLNWQTENPGWNFDAVKSAAQQEWDDLLGKIQRLRRAPTPRPRSSTACSTRTSSSPTSRATSTGSSMGSDFKAHTLASGQQDQYGIYSGWDTFHSLAELQTILDPSAAGDQAQSLLNYYAENGILQQWGYLQLDNYVMVGDPAQSIIADYYAFGARNFNTSEALSDMLKQATTVNDVRPGEALEQQYGYLPENGSYGCCNPHGYVPTLLEYDSEDLALSHFAAAFGDHKDAAMLEQRANNWENVFDPAGNLLNPRNADGTFVSGITADQHRARMSRVTRTSTCGTRRTTTRRCSICSAATARSLPRCRQYLSQPNGFGMFAQLTNEFDFGEQNALDYAGDPAGTQPAVNNIRNTMYPSGRADWQNNDDLGANSSSYIWEMLGLYPENSGIDNLVFASPGFPHASITLPNGHSITIDAPGASSTQYYVRSLTLNGASVQEAVRPLLEPEAGRDPGLEAIHQGDLLGERREGRAALLHSGHAAVRGLPAGSERDHCAGREHRGAGRRSERDREPAGGGREGLGTGGTGGQPQSRSNSGLTQWPRHDHDDRAGGILGAADLLQRAGQGRLADAQSDRARCPARQSADGV